MSISFPSTYNDNEKKFQARIFKFVFETPERGQE